MYEDEQAVRHMCTDGLTIFVPAHALITYCSPLISEHFIGIIYIILQSFYMRLGTYKDS